MDFGRVRKQPAAERPLTRRSLGSWLMGCWRRRWLQRLIVATASVAAAYFTSGWWLPAGGRWLDVGESPRASDYCLVLSGDFESRPFAAAALYRRGLVRKQIWLTHASTPDTVPAESEDSNRRAKLILTTLGVPPDRVVEFSGNCTNTFDEAAVLAHAMAADPTATVNVVTSNYHTRRARWIIRRVLGDNAVRVRYISVPTDYYDADCWWKVDIGFTTYTKEFSKHVFYLLRYGWGGIWIGILLAATATWHVMRVKRRRAATSVGV